MVLTFSSCFCCDKTKNDRIGKNAHHVSKFMILVGDAATSTTPRRSLLRLGSYVLNVPCGRDVGISIDSSHTWRLSPSCTDVCTWSSFTQLALAHRSFPLCRRTSYVKYSTVRYVPVDYVLPVQYYGTVPYRTVPLRLHAQCWDDIIYL